MPFTEKGSEILANFKKEYGEKKGTAYFYASMNAGKITGAHIKRPSLSRVARAKKK